MRNRSSAKLDRTALHLKRNGASSLPGSLSKLRKAWRILVPVDFSEPSLAALDYAIILAGQMGARLILLHVVEPALYGDHDPLAPLARADPHQTFLKEERERLERLVRERAGHGTQAEVLVRMGHPLSEIPDTARAVGADLVVLGAQGRGGVKHVLLGSTADRVMRRAPCPVLTIRGPSPEAFRSPVQRI